jgi:hypothetical protein
MFRVHEIVFGEFSTSVLDPPVVEFEVQNVCYLSVVRISTLIIWNLESGRAKRSKIVDNVYNICHMCFTFVLHLISVGTEYDCDWLET